MFHEEKTICNAFKINPHATSFRNKKE